MLPLTGADLHSYSPVPKQAQQVLCAGLQHNTSLTSLDCEHKVRLDRLISHWVHGLAQQWLPRCIQSIRHAGVCTGLHCISSHLEAD
jgi:hypothetical protein